MARATEVRSTAGRTVDRHPVASSNAVQPINMEGPFKGPLRFLERVMGIEPTFLAWEANVLPLNYTREIPAGVDSTAWLKP